MSEVKEEPTASATTDTRKSKVDRKDSKSCCTRTSCERLWWGRTTMADLVLPARQCACSVSGKYGWLFFVRLFLLVWTLAIIIAQLAVDQNWEVYFCFMTMWGWWSLMVHLLFAVIVTVRYVPDGKHENLDCLGKACFVSFSLCSTFALIVTLLYWILLYDSSNFDEPSDWVFGINNHALNLGIAALNFFSTRIVPLPIHVVFTFVISGLYVACNAACSLGNGVDVYSVLPWNEPTAMTIVLSIGGVIIGCLIFFSLLGFAFIRDKTCGRAIKAAATEGDPQIESQPGESTKSAQPISLT